MNALMLTWWLGDRRERRSPRLLCIFYSVSILMSAADHMSASTGSPRRSQRPQSAEALLRRVCAQHHWSLDFHSEHQALKEGEEMHAAEHALTLKRSSSTPPTRGGESGSDSDSDATPPSRSASFTNLRRLVSPRSGRNSPRDGSPAPSGHHRMSPLNPVRTSSVRITDTVKEVRRPGDLPDEPEFMQSATQLCPTTRIARTQACLDLLRHTAEQGSRHVETAAAVGEAALRLWLAWSFALRPPSGLTARELRRMTERMLTARELAPNGGDAELVKATIGEAVSLAASQMGDSADEQHPLDVLFSQVAAARPDIAIQIAALLDEAEEASKQKAHGQKSA